MTKSGLLFGIALALTVTAASAVESDVGSANYVMPACWHYLNSSNIDNFGQGRCVGLVEGIFYARPKCARQTE